MFHLDLVFRAIEDYGMFTVNSGHDSLGQKQPSIECKKYVSESKTCRFVICFPVNYATLNKPQSQEFSLSLILVVPGFTQHV